MCLPNSSAVQVISDLRDKLDGPGDDDQGITSGSAYAANLVPTDKNSLAYSRTPAQVLAIVVGSPTAHKGLFFPNGLNGNIK